MTASSGTGAAKNEGRTAMGVAGVFCCNSVAVSGFAAVGLPAGFGAPFPPAVGTLVDAATVVSCAGDVVSGPNSAAKLPELREPEFPWPNKPADEARAALVRFAGSMALVTIKVRAESPSRWKGSSPWMHLGHQPGDALSSAVRREKKQWNQGNRNLADGTERKAGVSRLGKRCPDSAESNHARY